METVFVMIVCDADHGSEAVRRIQKMAAVQEVMPTFGAYDLLVRIDAGTVEGIEHAVSREIRRMPGIISTCTLAVAR